MIVTDLDRWNSIGIQYWGHRSDRQIWAHSFILFPEFLRLLDKTEFASLLDFGCGDGYLIDYLQSFERYGEKQICGYDKSSELLHIAKIKHPHSVFLDHIHGFTFDVISMNMVIQDVAEPIPLLEDLRKALSINGIIIMSIPHPVFSLFESHHKTTTRIIQNPSNQQDIFRYLFEETEEVVWSRDCKASTHLYNRTLSTYSNIINAAGYSIINISEPLPIEEGNCDYELYTLNKRIPRYMFIVLQKK